MNKQRYISPREILSNSYINELASIGIKTDEQIIAHCEEELKQKGFEWDDEIYE